MYDPAHAELISAYLDGQLSPTERAQAESLLAEQPALRQLYEELQGLRQNLQSLPKVKLPSDFSQSVLRQAERTVLRGDEGRGDSLVDASSRSASRSTLATPAPRDAFATERNLWRRFARPAVWSALAVAAALMISVATREPDAGKRQTVALSTGKERPARDGREAEIARRDAPLPKVMTKGGDLLDRAEESASMRAAGTVGDAEQRRDLAESSVAPPPALPASAPQARPEGGAAVGRMRVPAENFSAKSGAGRPVDSDAVERKAGQDAAREAVAADEDLLSEGLLVVQCDVTPAVVEQNSLAAAFELQDIELAAADQPSTDEGVAAPASAAGFDKSAGARAALQPADSPVQLVYVEATAAQLRGALETLSQQPNAFVNINVLPPTVGTQADWSAYNRQNVALDTGPSLDVASQGKLRQAAPAAAAAEAADAPAQAGEGPGKSKKESNATTDRLSEADGDAETVSDDAVAAQLQSAVRNEVSQRRADYESVGQQETEQNATQRRAKAQQFALPSGNAVERALNGPAYQNLAKNQSQFGQWAGGKTQRAGDEKQLPQAADAVAAKQDAAAWQRAVFVLRVISPPAAAAPAESP